MADPTDPVDCAELLARVVDSAREPVIINGRVWTNVDADAWCAAAEHVIATTPHRNVVTVHDPRGRL